MNEPKRNHYVPQLLLRRFVNERGRLFFFNKSLADKGVMESTPRDLFVQRHLYTVFAHDGSKHTGAEKYFSYLENVVEGVVDKMVGAAQIGKAPSLTASEKEVWNLFVYHQWTRVPEQYEAIWTDTEADDLLEETVKEFVRTHRPLTDAEKSLLADEGERGRIIRNARIQALAVPGFQSIEVLGTRGLCIAMIAKPNKGFVIGSVPVAKLARQNASYLGDDDVELWLPIAKNIAVSPMGPAATERLVMITEAHHVRALNEAIFQQSRVIAGHSKALVVSVANAR